MKLVYAIISRDDTENVIKELNKDGHKVTKISSSGGFLRKGNTTLMAGVEDSEADKVIRIIETVCGERKDIEMNVPYFAGSTAGYRGIPYYGPAVKQTIEVGGAIIFVVNVDYYEKI